MCSWWLQTRWTRSFSFLLNCSSLLPEWCPHYLNKWTIGGRRLRFCNFSLKSLFFFLVRNATISCCQRKSPIGLNIYETSFSEVVVTFILYLITLFLSRQFRKLKIYLFYLDCLHFMSGFCWEYIFGKAVTFTYILLITKEGRATEILVYQ